MGLRGGIHRVKARRLAATLVILLAGLSVFAFFAPRSPSRITPAALTPSASVNLPNLTRQGLVLPMGTGDAPDALQVAYPSVLLDHGVYKMWYFEVQPSPWYAQIAYATSADGRNWTKHGAVLSPTLPNESFDVAYPTVALVNGEYWMWYVGYDGSSTYRIFAATSPDGVSWTKHGVVLDLGPPGSPDSASVAYPFVLYDNGRYDMWYTGLASFSPPDNAAIMFATSSNGLNWTKEGVVLRPGGAGSLDAYNVFTAGVVKDGSTFVTLYMGQDANVTSRLFWATSSDGMTWDKVGVALAPDPPAEDSVGGADPVILPDGTWMVYYGVRNDTSDIQIYLASSGNAASSPPPPSPSPSQSGPTSSLMSYFDAFEAYASPLGAALVVTLAGAALGAGLGTVATRNRRP